MEEEIERLRQRIAELEEENARLKEENSHLKEENSHLKERNEQLEIDANPLLCHPTLSRPAARKKKVPPKLKPAEAAAATTPSPRENPAGSSKPVLLDGDGDHHNNINNNNTEQTTTANGSSSPAVSEKRVVSSVQGDSESGGTGGGGPAAAAAPPNDRRKTMLLTAINPMLAIAQMSSEAARKRGSTILKGGDTPRCSLDSDLQKKIRGKFDPQSEEELRAWLRAMLPNINLDPDLHRTLKSGVVLCNLMLLIKPGSIRGIGQAETPFVMMENINKYLEACKKLGMPTTDLFQTIDLFEAKNMTSVLTNVHSLGRFCHKLDGYNGPSIPAR